jgi:hypothetical protein
MATASIQHKPIDEMRRVLRDATLRPAINPETRAQTVALLCVADWLEQLDLRMRKIEGMLKLSS